MAKAHRLLAGACAALLAAYAAPLLAQEVATFEIEGSEIRESLTGQPGNPARGRQIVRDLSKATCLICHPMPIPEEPNHGDIGPPLAGVGSRYSSGELRLRIVDAKAINPDTVMPAYHRVDGLYRVLDRYEDRPIYNAQEVEDVVAYLASLREP